MVQVTEPDSWNTGDWVIWNDVSGTGEWQKIDNSSVLSGVGTGQTVAYGKVQVLLQIQKL